MNRTPYLSKILYAILLSPLESKQSTSIRDQSALFQPGSNYLRTISIMKLIDSAIPGFADRLSHLMYRKNRFPWAPVETDLIAFGSGTAVIKLNWEKGQKVLRIYRKSLGKSSKEIIETAKHYKRNYEKVISWYGDKTGIVLPMDFMILYGLPFATPVAASLQPYVHGQKQDPWQCFSDDELLGLLEKHDRVRKQFMLFARQTIHQWMGQKMCFDLLGSENLMLTNQQGRYKLFITDVGIFKFDVIAKKYPRKMKKIKQRMDRLITLYQVAKEIFPEV